MIEVVEYDEAWPALFERLRDTYVAALDSAGEYGVGVGADGVDKGKRAIVTESTAVPAACQP